MTDYLVSIYAKLFTVHRIVQAANKADAAAQVSQQGAHTVWVEVAIYED